MKLWGPLPISVGGLWRRQRHLFLGNNLITALVKPCDCAIRHLTVVHGLITARENARKSVACGKAMRHDYLPWFPRQKLSRIEFVPSSILCVIKCTKIEAILDCARLLSWIDGEAWTICLKTHRNRISETPS